MTLYEFVIIHSTITMISIYLWYVFKNKLGIPSIESPNLAWFTMPIVNIGTTLALIIMVSKIKEE